MKRKDRIELNQQITKAIFLQDELEKFVIYFKDKPIGWNTAYLVCRVKSIKELLYSYVRNSKQQLKYKPRRKKKK